MRCGFKQGDSVVKGPFEVASYERASAGNQLQIGNPGQVTACSGEMIDGKA